MKKINLAKIITYSFILSLLLMIPTLGFSETGKSKTAQPLQHQKRYYFSPEGRFFVPAGMKLYLKVTNSPEENAPSQFLKSKTSLEKNRKVKEKASPLPFSIQKGGQNKIAVLSGSGKSALRKKPSRQDDGNRDQIVEMYYVNLDNNPPTSSVIFSPALMIKLGKTRIYGKPIQFRLKMADNASGLQGTFVSVNGAAFSAYQRPLPFFKEMDYHFRYYSVDNVGKVEDLKQVAFSIDLTPPASSHHIKNVHSGNILSPKTNLILQSTDN